MQASAFIGWQLPTYSGTKSYQNLLVEVYGGTTGTDWSNTKLDTIVQNNPTSLIRSGGYVYDTGSTTYYISIGQFWILQHGSNTRVAKLLYFYYGALRAQLEGTKGNGFSIRYLVPLEFYSGPLATPYLQWY